MELQNGKCSGSFARQSYFNCWFAFNCTNQHAQWWICWQNLRTGPVISFPAVRETFCDISAMTAVVVKTRTVASVGTTSELERLLFLKPWHFQNAPELRSQLLSRTFHSTWYPPRLLVKVMISSRVRPSSFDRILFAFSKMNAPDVSIHQVHNRMVQQTKLVNLSRSNLLKNSCRDWKWSQRCRVRRLKH